MAKERKIQREAPVVEAKLVSEVGDGSPIVVGDASSLNEEIVLPARVGILSIRVLGNFVLFNEGLKMRRVSIERGKPIIVSLRQ